MPGLNPRRLRNRPKRKEVKFSRSKSKPGEKKLSPTDYQQSIIDKGLGTFNSKTGEFFQQTRKPIKKGNRAYKIF